MFQKGFVCVEKCKYGLRPAFVHSKKPHRMQAASSERSLGGKQRPFKDNHRGVYLRKMLFRTLTGIFNAQTVFAEGSANEEQNSRTGAGQRARIQKDKRLKDNANVLSPLLNDILRKVAEVLGMRADREKEVELLKHQLSKRRCSLPGHISGVMDHFMNQDTKEFIWEVDRLE